MMLLRRVLTPLSNSTCWSQNLFLPIMSSFCHLRLKHHHKVDIKTLYTESFCSICPVSIKKYDIEKVFHRHFSFTKWHSSSCHEDVDFSSLAQDVLEVSKASDVMANAVPLQTVVNLLQHLSGEGFPLIATMRVLSGRIWLLRQPQAVISLANTLTREYGFDYQVTLRLLKDLPPEYCLGEVPLLKISPMVAESLQQLTSLGFNFQLLDEMLQRRPTVLLNKPSTFRHIFSHLKGLFTNSDAIKVAQTCPEIFSRPWDDTNVIFDYAFFTMCYTQSQIVTSNLLSHSLSKLRHRHVFLQRAGQFVKVKAKDDPRLNPNPSLRVLVGSSDADFAREFGGISLTEYKVFLEMLQTEDSFADYDSDDSDSTDAD